MFAALFSVLLHVPVLVWFLDATYFRPPAETEPRPMKVGLLQDPAPDQQDDEEPKEEDEEPKDEDGQIVEIAPPEEEERPEEAKFLSEYNSTVEEETVDPRYRLDREVTAETYSPDDAYEFEKSEGVEVDQPFTGSVAGHRLFREGRFSLFPDRTSEWDVDTGVGIAAPAPSISSESLMAGSPSNDYLADINRSDRTALNTFETLYASWWNRVKQYVSFYAGQTLANAQPKTAITKLEYSVTLSGLINPDGSIAALDVVVTSGIPEFDEAVKEAFELAAPFPDPPEGLVEADGFVHMRKFGFVITMGTAQADMSGIDPRMNVQFPGLQTIRR